MTPCWVEFSPRKHPASPVYNVCCESNLPHWGNTKKEAEMFGRVSTFEGSPEQVVELTRFARDQVLPALEGLDGFSGILGLVDCQSGKVIAVTLWESEEALRASEEAANRLRDESAGAVNETITGVERYEVTFAEIKGARL